MADELSSPEFSFTQPRISVTYSSVCVRCRTIDYTNLFDKIELVIGISLRVCARLAQCWRRCATARLLWRFPAVSHVPVEFNQKREGWRSRSRAIQYPGFLPCLRWDLIPQLLSRVKSRPFLTPLTSKHGFLVSELIMRY